PTRPSTTSGAPSSGWPPPRRSRRLLSNPCVDLRATVRRSQGRTTEGIPLPAFEGGGRSERRSWPERYARALFNSLLVVAGERALHLGAQPRHGERLLEQDGALGDVVAERGVAV